MHRFLMALVLPALAACGTTSSGASPDAVGKMLDDPHPDTQARLVEMGDDAVPSLIKALQDPLLTPPKLNRAARALGRIRQHTGNAPALAAYVEALAKVSDDPRARALLEEAHRFRDPEGKVVEHLSRAIRDMRVVTPAMISAAGVLGDLDALEGAMKVVAVTAGEPASTVRDVALRYIGRAARHGSRSSVDFLTKCTQAPQAELVTKSGDELKLIAGQEALKGWRAWWFNHQSQDRRSWLAESFGTVGGLPFDPTDRDHIGELVARIPLDRDAEPEMWLFEKACERKFGYVSPRDAFDPELDPEKLAASNRTAIETARAWWTENSRYLYYRSATSRFEISEEGRRIGVPVHPRTGKPGQ